jgi:hypothetical protein
MTGNQEVRSTDGDLVIALLNTDMPTGRVLESAFSPSCSIWQGGEHG